MLVVPNNHDDQLFHLQTIQNLQSLQHLQAIQKIQSQRSHPAADVDALSALSLTSSPDLAFNLDLDFDPSQQQDDIADLSMLGAGDRTMQSADAWLNSNTTNNNNNNINNISNVNNNHASSLARALSSSRNSHNRESSLSSLGSTSVGPASPFSQNTSNPHIAVGSSDPLGDAAYANAMPSSYYDDATAAFQQQMLKPAYGAAPAAYTTSHDSLSAPYRSQPVSVASSIASNSPATPSLDQPDDDAARRRNGENTAPWASLGGESGSQEDDDIYFLDRDGHEEDAIEDDECSRFFDELVAYHAPPKFDRTMTDIYNDELYSPSFAVPAPTSSPAPPAALAQDNMFARRLQQFNNQALGTASPTSAGNQSPFQQGSPAASSMRFGPQSQQQQQLQQMQQQQQHQQQLQQQLQHQQQLHHQQQVQQQHAAAVAQAAATHASGTPQTISPKDSVLEYRDPDTDSSATPFPLFAQGGGAPTAFAAMSPSYGNMNGMAQGFRYGTQMVPNLQQQLAQPYANFLGPRHNAPAANGATSGSKPQQQPQQQPSQQPSQQPQQPQQQSTTGRVSPAMPPMRPIAASLARSGLVRPVPNSQRPGLSVSDGATYTCTYHGCTQRFETPALLQKHKREGHRQANAAPNARKGDGSADGSVSPTLMNSQAGPHRCDRINPGTGKPCATVFSRPYDLTRHEDTIHNARKQKVRCNLCTEEKTFSRADALTRHFRVCHPDVEFPGKHRKRGHAA